MLPLSVVPSFCDRSFIPLALSSDSIYLSMQVSARKCPNMRPPSREQCNAEECPQWFAGIWSEVRHFRHLHCELLFEGFKGNLRSEIVNTPSFWLTYTFQIIIRT